MSKGNKISHRTSLKGKTVVVTGASSGVGRAIACAFARHGASLVLAARRRDALEEVVSECKELGGTAIAVQTDVTDAVAVKSLAENAVSSCGQIDVWINNAGVLAAGDFTETPVEVHDQVIRTNLMGYLHGAHAVIPYFKNQKHGILINNISVGGWFPVPYAVGYSASKFGLRGFSEALRGELVGWPGIHICNIFPAFLDTPGIQHAGNFTGRVLRPAPPVYDPQRVARAVVSLVKHPVNTTTVGSMASLLRLGHFILPAFTRTITASVIQTYFNHADQTQVTRGNLFEPVSFGASIHGGWSLPAGPTKHKLKTALLIGGLAAAFLLLAKKSNYIASFDW